jgi:hypothetical protein
MSGTKTHKPESILKRFETIYNLKGAKLRPMRSPHSHARLGSQERDATHPGVPSSQSLGAENRCARRLRGVAFVPSFLWNFFAGPYVEALGTKRALRAARTTGKAEVVGVILNRSQSFALHTLFGRVCERRYGVIHPGVVRVARNRWGHAVLSSAVAHYHAAS